MEANVVFPAKAILGEGAIWHQIEKVLYWVDIEGCQVHCFDPTSGMNKSTKLPERVGTVVPRRNGQLIVALEKSIAALDFQTGQLETICPLEADLPENRSNDGKCDPSGNFWIGSMSMKLQQGAGSLYKVGTDHCVTKALNNVTISNGLVWSADTTTFYYIDTPSSRVDAFDFSPGTGSISNRRTVFEIPGDAGSPDGMTIDKQGNLWIALFSGSAVGSWDPQTGQQIAVIEVDAPLVTSCAFGDDNLDTLYITTAASEGSSKSGSLFAVKPGVEGVPASFFEG